LRQLNDASHLLNEAHSLQHLAQVIAEQASALFERPASARIEVGETREVAGADLDGVTGTTAVGFANGEDQTAVLIVAPPAKGAESVLPEEEQLVLSQFARAAKTALKNIVVYDIEREIAVTLQQSLLPTIIPEIPHAKVAVRYRASAEHAEVGGDFYEIFALREHRIALAIGDVAGHSLEAAAIMAQLRTGIRSYMLEGHSPLSTLERLNAMLQRFHPGTSATVCCATYDWESGEVEIANAGHPPPLIVTGQNVTFLPFGGTLLGVTPVQKPPTKLTIAPGSMMLLYTDGLIERRTEPIDTGFDRLAAAAILAAEDLESYVDRLLSKAGPAKPSDDIALVALRRLPRSTDASMTVSRPADQDAPAFMRAEASEFLTTMGAPPQKLTEVLLAISEAVTNAAEHAYPDGAGDVRMHVNYSASGLCVEVADTGSFLDRLPQAGRGRGLPIIRAVARDVKIHRQGGTRVVMTFDLRRQED
jgi:serine phosphatase RsbU (regulator of sigma subunit)/anti-sigma regulatory factor (Ser/Thr protein kinase)